MSLDLLNPLYTLQEGSSTGWCNSPVTRAEARSSGYIRVIYEMERVPYQRREHVSAYFLTLEEAQELVRRWNVVLSPSWRYTLLTEALEP